MLVAELDHGRLAGAADAHQDGLAEPVLLRRLHDEGGDDALLDGGAQRRHAAELQAADVRVRLRRRTDAVAGLRAAACSGTTFFRHSTLHKFWSRLSGVNSFSLDGAWAATNYQQILLTWMSRQGTISLESTCLLMARTEMPSLSKRQATSATRARMLFRSAMRVPLSAYFMLVLSSAAQTRI